MGYERIEKPFAQGGFSPTKLRAMLLGVEKKQRREEKDEGFAEETGCSLRSEPTGIDDNARDSDACRDVDMVLSVSSQPECSMETSSGQRPREQNTRMMRSSRTRSIEDDCFDSDSVSSGFEFQKAEPRARQHNRPVLVPPFSKPKPSKWDDAQKWIASPTSSRLAKGGGLQTKKSSGLLGNGSQQGGMKAAVDGVEDAETKRVDPSQTKREIEAPKSVSWVPDSYPVVDSEAKPTLVAEKSIADSAINISRHDSAAAVQSATSFITPPSTVKSVSMRDMGTEMTPVASQEPSRTGTPGSTTPMRSPNSSRPLTPKRTGPISTTNETADCKHNSSKEELSEKELQKKTRREIMILGTQLGKMNIAAWASHEEEETDASSSLKTAPVDQTAKSVIETHAAAWEEAVKAKYSARFKREEMKIQAWENHQKAKAEAEMRKIQVEVERMRVLAQETLMNKLAATRQKSEQKRAAAEIKRNQQAAKTAKQAEHIRRTGQIPASFSCWSCCF